MEYLVFPNGYNPIFNINMIGYADTPEHTHYGPYTFNANYNIHYVLSGKGYYCDHPVSAGQGFLIFPHDTVEYHADPKDPWKYMWFNIEDPKMPSLLPHYNVNPETGIFDYGFAENAVKLSEEIVKHNQCVMNPLILVEWFFHILNQHPEPRLYLKNADEYLTFFTNYVNQNIHTPLRIATIVERMGISQQYLYSICKKKLDVSPKDYIINRKIVYAKRMLRESNASISDVAAALGFNDIFLFSRFFSRHTDMSPTEYRYM